MKYLSSLVFIVLFAFNASAQIKATQIQGLTEFVENASCCDSTTILLQEIASSNDSILMCLKEGLTVTIENEPFDVNVDFSELTDFLNDVVLDVTIANGDDPILIDFSDLFDFLNENDLSVDFDDLTDWLATNALDVNVDFSDLINWLATNEIQVDGIAEILECLADIKANGIPVTILNDPFPVTIDFSELTDFLSDVVLDVNVVNGDEPIEIDFGPLFDYLNENELSVDFDELISWFDENVLDVNVDFTDLIDWLATNEIQVEGIDEILECLAEIKANGIPVTILNEPFDVTVDFSDLTDWLTENTLSVDVDFSELLDWLATNDLNVDFSDLTDWLNENEIAVDVDFMELIDWLDENELSVDGIDEILVCLDSLKTLLQPLTCTTLVGCYDLRITRGESITLCDGTVVPVQDLVADGLVNSANDLLATVTSIFGGSYASPDGVAGSLICPGTNQHSLELYDVNVCIKSFQLIYNKVDISVDAQKIDCDRSEEIVVCLDSLKTLLSDCNSYSQYDLVCNPDPIIRQITTTCEGVLTTTFLNFENPTVEVAAPESVIVCEDQKVTTQKLCGPDGSEYTQVIIYLGTDDGSALETSFYDSEGNVVEEPAELLPCGAPAYSVCGCTSDGVDVLANYYIENGQTLIVYTTLSGFELEVTSFSKDCEVTILCPADDSANEDCESTCGASNVSTVFSELEYTTCTDPNTATDVLGGAAAFANGGGYTPTATLQSFTFYPAIDQAINEIEFCANWQTNSGIGIGAFDASTNTQLLITDYGTSSHAQLVFSSCGTVDAVHVASGPTESGAGNSDWSGAAGVSCVKFDVSSVTNPCDIVFKTFAFNTDDYMSDVVINGVPIGQTLCNEIEVPLVVTKQLAIETTCQTEIETGCDIDDDNELIEGITRSVEVCSDGVITTTWFTNFGTATQATYEPLSGLFDCITREEIPEPEAPAPLCSDWEIVNAWVLTGEFGVNKTVYSPITATLNGQNGTGPSDVFTGAPGANGLNTIDPTLGTTATYTLETDLNLLDGINGRDAMEVCTYINLPASAQLREIRGTWDAINFYVGECCADPILVESCDYPCTGATVNNMGTYPEGTHELCFHVFDWSFWAGLDVEYSYDGVTWDDVPPGWLYKNKPSWQECEIDYCPETELYRSDKGLVANENVERCSPIACDFVNGATSVVDDCETYEVCYDVPSAIPTVLYSSAFGGIGSFDPFDPCGYVSTTIVEVWAGGQILDLSYPMTMDLNLGATMQLNLIDYFEANCIRYNSVFGASYTCAEIRVDSIVQTVVSVNGTCPDGFLTRLPITATCTSFDPQRWKQIKDCNGEVLVTINQEGNVVESLPATASVDIECAPTVDCVKTKKCTQSMTAKKMCYQLTDLQTFDDPSAFIALSNDNRLTYGTNQTNYDEMKAFLSTIDCEGLVRIEGFPFDFQVTNVLYTDLDQEIVFVIDEEISTTTQVFDGRAVTIGCDEKRIACLKTGCGYADKWYNVIHDEYVEAGELFECPVECYQTPSTKELCYDTFTSSSFGSTTTETQVLANGEEINVPVSAIVAAQAIAFFESCDTDRDFGVLFGPTIRWTPINTLSGEFVNGTFTLTATGDASGNILTGNYTGFFLLRCNVTNRACMWTGCGDDVVWRNIETQDIIPNDDLYSCETKVLVSRTAACQFGQPVWSVLYNDGSTDILAAASSLDNWCECSTGTTSGASLPAADGKVVSDNFQDGQNNAPFNLQVRNTTGNSVSWEALIENVPYQAVPVTPGAYTLVTTPNADGTFNHLFSGTLGAFSNITITGTVPTPAGDGSGLTLYCEQN